MLPKMNVLSQEELLSVHENTMRILEEVGVEFLYQPAVDLLQEHGQRAEGQRVYFNRAFVEEQIKKAPESFTLHARNPEKSVTCGKNSFLLLPGYGAPYVYDAEGNRRLPTMADYDNMVKLAGASPNMDLTGGNLCEPVDVGDEVRHLHMLYSHMIHADKPFMGSAYGEVGATDTLAMAEMVYGGREKLAKNPALSTLINSITPLKFDDRMLSALMAYARAGQCCVISALVMAGSTGPVTLAGTLSLQNAEVLAGIVLAQCVNPGAPVIYGSTSAAVDMRSVSLSIGNGEAALLTSASAQLGRFYGIPTRGGGGLCDAKAVDGQAGYESMMTLMAAGLSGINYVLHAAGILQAYAAFSFEKFAMDDEIASLVRQYMRGITFSPVHLAFEDIQEVGPGGHFLFQESTLDLHMTELNKPTLSDRNGYDTWVTHKKDTNTLAKEKWQNMLDNYTVPDMDAKLKEELNHYIKLRTEEL